MSTASALLGASLSSIQTGCIGVLCRDVGELAHGYLAACMGTHVKVLHASEADGWIYGVSCTTESNQGWLRRADFLPILRRVKATALIIEPADGYLPLCVGDEIDVLYEGSMRTRDAGWLYGQIVAVHPSCKCGWRGWFSDSFVDIAPLIFDRFKATETVEGCSSLWPAQSEDENGNSDIKHAPPEDNDKKPTGPVSSHSLQHATYISQLFKIRVLGQDAPNHVTWTYPLCDEENGCFAGYCKSGIDNDKLRYFLGIIMDEIPWEKPFGPMGYASRSTAWLVQQGCTCGYRYGGAHVQPALLPPCIEEVMQAVMPLCGLHNPSTWPNCCNLNCYADGTDTLGWHSDDEALFTGDSGHCRIISLSLGAERKFELRTKESQSPLCKLSLSSGDILTMEGLTQKYYEHRIPKGGKLTRLRVNLTWRWIIAHEHKCGFGK